MNHTELFRTYLAPLRQQKSGDNLRHARRGSSPARLKHLCVRQSESKEVAIGAVVEVVLLLLIIR